MARQQFSLGCGEIVVPRRTATHLRQASGFSASLRRSDERRRAGVEGAGDAYDGLQFWFRMAGAKTRSVLVYGGESQFQRQSVWTWSVF